MRRAVVQHQQCIDTNDECSVSKAHCMRCKAAFGIASASKSRGCASYGWGSKYTAMKLAKIYDFGLHIYSDVRNGRFLKCNTKKTSEDAVVRIIIAAGDIHFNAIRL